MENGRDTPRRTVGLSEASSIKSNPPCRDREPNTGLLDSLANDLAGTDSRSPVEHNEVVLS